MKPIQDADRRIDRCVEECKKNGVYLVILALDAANREECPIMRSAFPPAVTAELCKHGKMAADKMNDRSTGKWKVETNG